VRRRPERSRAAAASARPFGGDRLFALSVLILLGLGVVLVGSASAAISAEYYGTPYRFLLRQVAHVALGLAALVLLARMDYRRLISPAVVWGLLLTVIALLVLALLGPSVNGVSRWVLFAGLSLQPSEFAKLALVLFIAREIHRRKESSSELSPAFLVCAVVLAQIVLLVALEPDLGACAVLTFLFVALVFAAGIPWRHVLGFTLAAGAGLAIYAMSAEYRVARIMAFLNPGADPLGVGFQARQSLIALGTGGLTGTSHAGPLGTGFGEGLQKLFYLPYPHTDFIFAVLGEELGLLGTVSVLALFTIILWKGVSVSLRAPDTFGALLALGMTLVIVGQAYLNIGVTLGLLPTKGFALPLVSYGGSACVAACAAAGLVLSVAAAGER
jgi:cell division protein FtsW